MDELLYWVGMAAVAVTAVTGVLEANGYRPTRGGNAEYSLDFSIEEGPINTDTSITLSERGDERYENVTMVDLRLSRRFRFGGNRSFQPEISIFNLGNADTAVSHTVGIGGNYLVPTEILSPRIMRIGFTLNF